MDRSDRLAGLMRAQAALGAYPSLGNVTWCSPEAPVVDGIHLGTCIDITVNDICDTEVVPWLWSVVADDDPTLGGQPGIAFDPVNAPLDVNTIGQRSSATSGPFPPMLAIPYDAAVWAVYDPSQRWYLAGSAVVVPLDDEPAADELAALYDDADACGGEIECVPAWRSTTIDAALESWCAMYLGRPDLTFIEDPEMRPAYVEALIARAEEGDENRYEIADGLYITDEVFDELLSMSPDQAAKITELLRNLSDDLSGDDAGRRSGDVNGADPADES